ncbi:MAG: gephyrin-like molybdotransferase Glp [Pseudomonadota bacterium]
MISVDEALERILSAFTPLPAETISIGQAIGRVLAENITARVDQPPHDVSAMDGYAVRAEDLANGSAKLSVIGHAPAGHPCDKVVGPGQAVRLFTGSVVPKGADAIVIQEDTEASGNHVTVNVSVPKGHYVRPAGLDFRIGTQGAPTGRQLTARDVGLAAAMNVPWVKVRRRPRIAILTTGDEVVLPGEPLGPGQIVASNGLALSAFVTVCGGEPMDLGVAPDQQDRLSGLMAAAKGADLLLTTGGASVGDHDLIRSTMDQDDRALDFWRIAMRPGKPLIFGRLGTTPLLGLPGNPVSSLVCATIFLRPTMERMMGRDPHGQRDETALLASALPENDQRQDYLRATLSYSPDGHLLAEPYNRQDSSMLATLSHSDCLIVRPPFAPAVGPGESVKIVRLTGGCLSI